MHALATAPGTVREVSKYYLDADEVMEYLDCKKSKAYQLVRAMRKELIDAGKLTPEYPAGKIPKKYFFERCMIEE